MFEKRNGRKKLKSNKKRLEELKGIITKYNLNSSQETNDMLQKVVEFINAISCFQDDGYIPIGPEYMWKFFHKECEAIVIINRCIVRLGRDEKGLNRTEKWQKVTAQDVYINQELIDVYVAMYPDVTKWNKWILGEKINTHNVAYLLEHWEEGKAIRPIIRLIIGNLQDSISTNIKVLLDSKNMK